MEALWWSSSESSEIRIIVLFSMFSSKCGVTDICYVINTFHAHHFSNNKFVQIFIELVLDVRLALISKEVEENQRWGT